MGEQVARFAGPDVALSDAEASSLRQGRHVVAVSSGVFRVEGPGALQCVQGIFTNDVVKRAADALVWGGVLTPKGMIIFDMWVLRDDDAAWMIVPGGSRETAAQLFRRTFPPRIAKVHDCTDETPVHWLLGGTPVAARNAIVIPASPAPFAALVLGSGGPTDAAVGDWQPAAPHWADAALLLAGWPATGREIDERTLPQEVRFDELDGVSYEKGCYTGQETVARLHFRGHANRTLRGIRWNTAGPDDRSLRHEGKDVGTISTWGRIGSHAIGLAKVRREVHDGAALVAGGTDAVLTTLPFEGW